MSGECTQDDKDAIIQQLQQQLSMLNTRHNENLVYKKFMEYSTSFSNNGIILGRDGLNYEQWKYFLNLSLEMGFPYRKDFCDSQTNFGQLNQMDEISLWNLIIKTIDPEFY
ncbi:hypothetical protein O181_025280 [Austropuccinia psidii MF-1]|uniref:Uncharacterized protein n=1 Tax=Austropuccinia psidii MF-1 TaxID=1389203 RepID=A0A9Q3CMB7_9BASI|nr:hypothetical protein [Austropuccinia psidii MF-1]